MNTSEKIISAAVGILVVLLIVFSYYEIKEKRSGFEESFGQDFKIGQFTAVVGKVSSGEQEENCEPLRPVIISALHDISVHLDMQNTFEVNEQTLQLFCQKNSEITLADANGNKLLLQKVPFGRGVPPEGTGEDVGTKVRINATIIPAGAPVPAQPTTYADVLIPDRFLDTATSTGR